MTNYSCTEPAPAPHDSNLDEIVANSEQRSIRSSAKAHTNNFDDDYSEEESYTRRLIESDKTLKNAELLSDSRVYTIES